MNVFRFQILLATLAIVGLVPDLFAQQPGPASPTVLDAEPAPDLNVLFNNKTGWIGADAAYSVPLDGNRVLWFFGDTLIGTVKEGRRTDCSMVNNSLALQTGLGKGATIRFVTGKPKDGKPTSFFLPPDGKGWLWPQGSVQCGEQLFLVVSQIDKAGGGGAFGFKQIGHWLAAIENPNDEPAAWRVKYSQIPFVNFEPLHVQSWGSAFLAEGGNVYIYGFEEKEKGIGKKRLTVARAPANQLSDFTSWRFRAKTGWSESAGDATALADGLATEFSVTAMPGGKGLVLVYTENGLSDRVLARFAPEPQGPWSTPVLLYTTPEMKADKGVFCYSAKAHPWAATGDELVLTYCQNTWEFGKVFQSDSVYRPKFVRVHISKLTAE